MERLKFYADTSKEKNKFFCWKINSIMDLESRLEYWMKRVYIRAAWYECIDTDTGEVINQRIDLVHFTDYQQILFSIEKI
jgi:hypothetical protein